MLRRAQAFFMSGEVRISSRFSSAGRMSASVVPERRTSPALSGWDGLRSWPSMRSETERWSASPRCATGWNSGIVERVEDCAVNGAGAARVPNTTNLQFENLEGEALVIALDLKGLAVSGGSACMSGATEPSHVLTAMGLVTNRARASLRFSLTKLNTDREIDAALELVPAAVSRLRELAPVNAGTLG